mmetsp:Transcript_15491/g.27652  ORF Transcript_15491/g.27652 Transcript_15491/m.27652 type:complete len:309 (-) Transcript_15491:1889-2815(-)
MLKNQYEDVLLERLRHYGPNATVSYDAPLVIVRGSGTYLFDREGRPYLDCVNNVASVGHGNPEVADFVSNQLRTLNTNSRYLHPDLQEYARELLKTMPPELEVIYLVNSGSEANELALRMARAASRLRKVAMSSNKGNCTNGCMSNASHTSPPPSCDHVVVMGGAYHGHTTSLIDMSPYKFWGHGGEGRRSHVHVIPAPDVFRGRNLDGGMWARAAIAQSDLAGMQECGLLDPSTVQKMTNSFNSSSSSSFSSSSISSLSLFISSLIAPFSSSFSSRSCSSSSPFSLPSPRPSSTALFGTVFEPAKLV